MKINSFARNSRAFALLSLILLGQNASADPKSFFYRRHLQRQELQRQLSNPAARDLDVTRDANFTAAGTFDQKINPADSGDARTFKQRYYVNSSYASGPNAPVLFYICGEATCTGGELGGAVGDYAKKLKAHRVALEHRYYGKSQPFATLATANLVYLTTDNALADLAAFQKFATSQLGLSGRWLTIGGSYPGSLAAYYRLKYPELTVGSLASSAPVQARANFEEYDLHVAKVVDGPCAVAMRKVVKQVQATLNQPAELLKMKQLFDAVDVRDTVEFMYVIADMGAIAVQYGYKDEFCDNVTQGDPLQGYARIGKELFRRFGITAVEDTFQSAESIDPNDYLNGFGMRAWAYQSCLEYGYWQNAYRDPAVSVRSPLINAAFHDSVCKRLFGFEQSVNTETVNAGLYRPLLEPATSRIMFTNGANDPWSNLSISPLLGNDTNPNLTTAVIPGASHCDDLGTPSISDNAEMKKARETFLKLAQSWLAK